MNLAELRDSDKSVIRVPDLLDLLDGEISRSSLYEAIRRGDVPGVLPLGRKILISVPAVIAWLDPTTTDGLTRDETGLPPGPDNTSTPIRQPRQKTAGRHG